MRRRDRNFLLATLCLLGLYYHQPVRVMWGRIWSRAWRCAWCGRLTDAEGNLV